MSYEQKYKKYKTKYLNLKMRINNSQSGSSLNSSDVLENLTATPDFSNKINLKGGSFDNELDLENLTATPNFSNSVKQSNKINLKGGNFDNELDLENLTATPNFIEQYKKLNNLIGGNVKEQINKAILDVENLSVTHTTMELFGYNFYNNNLIGGVNKSNNDSELQHNSKILQSTVSDDELSHNSKVSTEDSELKNDSELSQTAGSKSESSYESEVSQNSESSYESEVSQNSELKVDSTKSNDLAGGAKKSRTLSDSDFELETATTESKLSLLDSDSIKSTDLDL